MSFALIVVSRLSPPCGISRHRGWRVILVESFEYPIPPERICVARPTRGCSDLNIAPETLLLSSGTLGQCPAPGAGSERAVATKRFYCVRTRAHDLSRLRGNYSCK